MCVYVPKMKTNTVRDGHRNPVDVAIGQRKMGKPKNANGRHNLLFSHITDGNWDR